MKNLSKIATFLEMEEIANGCGGKTGFRFETVIEVLKQLPYFDHVKGEDLWVKLRSLCAIHDMFYDLGGNWVHRLVADVWFVTQVFYLFSWIDWKYRWSFCISIHIGLRRYGKDYFNYC